MGSDGNFTKFTLEEDTTIWISLSQIAPRMVPKSENYNAYPGKILLARMEDDDSLHYCAHLFGAWKQDINLEARCQTGTYVAWTQVDADGSTPSDTYNVSTYSPSPVHPESVEIDDGRNQILESSGEQ
jgi:hypothetical protein